MQRLSAWARGIASVIFTGVVLPLVVYFIEQQPPETAPAVLKFFLNLAQQTWLRVTALVLAGFVAGLWLDWLLRKLDGSRAKAREHLGTEMMDLARNINKALARHSDLQGFSPRLMSAFIKAKQLGLWAPTEFQSTGSNIPTLMGYLRHVGTLLRDRHFAEAKQAALECRNNLPQQSR
jgi:hypothetical protein